tara:strand:+ start:3562 stop:4860 length:1299 start_codon:yes stop_codon:yes gene_type:complete
MSLLILDTNINNSSSDNYQTFKTTLENLGLSVTINLLNTMADYNGTNPSPYGYSAVLINNLNKSSVNSVVPIYDQINQNAQTILMDYLNNGGRLLFYSYAMSNNFNINLETSWGELSKAIYSINNGDPWSFKTDDTDDISLIFLNSAIPDLGIEYNTEAIIKQTNSSTILNNVPSEFTWNPVNFETKDGFGIKINNIFEVDTLKTNDYVLNSTTLKGSLSGKNITYPFFLSNSYGKGQVLIMNTIFGGQADDAATSAFLKPILEPNIARIIYNFVSLNDSDICFKAGSVIQTDQGFINIEDLKVNIHTINNEQILAVPVTHPAELEYLICIEKDAFEPNVPNKDTYLTHTHKIEYKGQLIEAMTFLMGNFKNKIYKVEYNNKEPLYNVLLKDYTKINVNNLVAETLHPDNKISKIYLNKKNKVFRFSNDFIL